MQLPQNKRLLVDGDILRYRCGFAVEKTYYLVEHVGESGDTSYWKYESYKQAKEDFDPGADTLWSRKEVQPEEFAYEAVNTVLESLCSKFNPSEIDIYLSDSTTFRHRIATTKPYKGNRDNSHKPTYYSQLGDFLHSKGAITLKDVEADDALAIEATKDPSGTIIVSIDKDLLQVPGNHFNWVTNEFIKQSKKGADFELAAQILSGDATDNIPGLPGIGAVKAHKLVSGAKSTRELMGRVLDAYKETKGEDYKEYLWEQMRLVYLLRTYEEKEANEILGFKV